MDKEKLNQNETPEVTDSDFAFVQQDASIHDQKFETKPTTYLKDAFKRFVKNRSSVVAGAILFVLIAMAIIVPVANQNDIDTPNGAASYLPPKWFNADLGGFLDGTGTVDNVVLDPADPTKLPSDSDYKSHAIIGEITSRKAYSDTFDTAVSKYGKGGAIQITNATQVNTSGHYDAPDCGILSPEVSLDLSDSLVNYEITFLPDAVKDNKAEDSSLKAFLGFYTDALPLPSTGEGEYAETGEDTTEDTVEEVSPYQLIPLTETTEIEGDTVGLSATNVVSILRDGGYLEGYAESTLSGQFAIIMAGSDNLIDGYNSLYVESATASGGLSSVSAASFDNATEAYSAITDSSATNRYTRYGSATTLGIYHSEVYYGTFRYDYYKAVFGDITGQEFTTNDINTYVSNGWIESISYVDKSGSTQYAYQRGVTEAVTFPRTNGIYNQITLVLTEEGDTYCPMRAIGQISVRNNPLESPDSPLYIVTHVYGTKSLYRQLYLQGRIGSCEYPMYIFGTDRNGKDFFKLVFSGLLTSLGLGVLSAAINIFVGLIWGAISGYFGGWVDLLMERFSEILGGMPFIVMMTLIVLLLGSNFWTFLLALCLTGWMGVAGETRRQFYRYKRREYVLASRTLGASDGRLIFKHILPNGIGPIITGAILMIPSVIFTEANISYLLPSALSFAGAQSFGITLSNVQNDLQTYPYLIVSASIIMALIMICFNLFGNGLRDAFNPALKGADD